MSSSTLEQGPEDDPGSPKEVEEAKRRWEETGGDGKGRHGRQQDENKVYVVEMMRL